MATAGVQGSKSPKGCWTCKRRKVGCDKTLPYCLNCTRSKRVCKGYGVKLTWPDKEDGRRKEAMPYDQEVSRVSLMPIHSQVEHFLNLSAEDISKTKSRVVLNRSTLNLRPTSNKCPSLCVSRNLTYTNTGGMSTQETFLLSYYTTVLSRMITTIDDTHNGFRNVLLPVALTENQLSSQSLRLAIFAVSASHLWGAEAAVKYKIAAIRLLSQSLNSGEDLHVSQFGTCMMLCVCDVFDSVDGSWSMHLKAAKEISARLSPRSKYGLGIDFLMTWLEYHDVLAAFSALSTDDTAHGASLQVPIALPTTSDKDSIILGSLGCSLEVFNIITCINKLHLLSQNNPNNTLPKEYEFFPMQLERQIEGLVQIPLIQNDDTSGHIDYHLINTTAELYRLATLIYLHQSLLHSSRYCNPLQSIVSQALDVIERLHVCSSPWPLFMIACEVAGDEQRIRVLRVFDTMQKVRGIGNVNLIRQMIETLWKRRDMEMDGIEGVNGDRQEIGWRDVFDTTQRLPSFI